MGKDMKSFGKLKRLRFTMFVFCRLITSGSSRKLTVEGKTINLQRAVPRNFAYKTRLAAFIVQALKATGAENIGGEEISALKTVIDKNPDKESFRNDVLLMPIWMKSIIKPLL